MMSRIRRLRSLAHSVGVITRRQFATSCALRKQKESWLGNTMAPDMHDPEKYDHVFVDTEPDKRPMKNEPFVKNLFVGNFDEVKCNTVLVILRFWHFDAWPIMASCS